MAYTEKDRIIDLSYPAEVIKAMGREEFIDHSVAVRMGMWNSNRHFSALARPEQIASYRERFPERYAALRASIEVELIECNVISEKLPTAAEPDSGRNRQSTLRPSRLDLPGAEEAISNPNLASRTARLSA